MSLREAFAFPEVVNDYAARCTAALVVTLAVVTIVVPSPARIWLAGALVVGFALRVAGGPRYSPFGRLSVHVLAPRVSAEPKLVSGSPKRFAQTIGLVVSGTAFVLSLLGYGLAAQLATGVLIAAATLEAVFGFCLGCTIFGFLQRRGVIPESVCEACNNISLRDPAAV